MAAPARPPSRGLCGSEGLKNADCYSYWSALRFEAQRRDDEGKDNRSHGLTPLAVELIESLLKPLLEAAALRAQTGAACLGETAKLRPETVADVLIDKLGINAIRPLTTVLRGRPNAWHHYLAAALQRGCSVVT